MRLIEVSSECFCCERVVRAIGRVRVCMRDSDSVTRLDLGSVGRLGWAAGQLGTTRSAKLTFIPTIHVNTFNDNDNDNHVLVF